jgi:predicted aldo/keto reductase-like oxidoreductase
MEPLRGGGLAYQPKPVAAVYDRAPQKRVPAEWAFRHLVNYPEVSNVLSGMSNMEQLKENIAMFSQADMLPNHLSEAELKIIADARAAYESIQTIACTQCGYCMPCPQKVDIPGAFGLYNDGHRFEHFDQPRRGYMFSVRGGRSADLCTQCGECLPKCPQDLEIPALLSTAHETLKGWTE